MILSRALFAIVCAGTIFAGWVTQVSAGAGHGAEWGYHGDTGPEHWGDHNKEFALCKNGKSQSPVNISNTNKAEGPPLEFHYKETPLDIVNNGHTIQVNYEPGSYLKIGDKKYDLLQFHFHIPSEHFVNGKPADMEMHFVHKNDKNELAVVGVLFAVATINSPLNTIWKFLPTKINESMENREIKANANDLLPKDHGYFSYSGSLTTPPCSEGVLWYVLKQPRPVTQNQINHFKELIDSNARPIQLLNKREIIRAE